MDFATLLADHKAQLGKAVDRFRSADDADFIRHLRLAGRWIDQRWPRVLLGLLTVSPEVDQYPAPTACAAVLGNEWGRYWPRRPWDDADPGIPPLLRLIDGETGPIIWVSPAPTQRQIQAWGDALRFRFRVNHVITPELVTARDELESHVLLAALIEALRDLSNETAIVQLHKGMAGVPTAGTPAYLYEALLREWENR